MTTLEKIEARIAARRVERNGMAWACLSILTLPIGGILLLLLLGDLPKTETKE